VPQINFSKTVLSPSSFLLIASLLVGSDAASAQAVQLTVLAEGVPAPSTLVLAVDATGATRRSVITSAAGTAVFELPQASTWTIRAERLGYGTAEISITVEEGTQEVVLEMDPHPLNIEGLNVQSQSLCGRESRGPEVVRVWMEARDILGRAGRSLADDSTALRLARREGLVRPDLYYPRELERLERTWRDLPEASFDTSWVVGMDPFLPPEPERVQSEGFATPIIEGGEETYLYDFHPPHPRLLLSDEFQSTHCFSIVRDEGAHPGLVGLHFEPNAQEVLDYDVTGTMWLPETNDSWPWIDFQFDPVPEQGVLRESGLHRCGRSTCRGGAMYVWPIMRPDGRLGGRIDLAFDDRLGWVVHRLRLSTPVVRREERLELDPGFMGETVRNQDLSRRELWIMWWVREVTLEVVEIRIGHGPAGGSQ
jgi:hypothetical protein